MKIEATLDDKGHLEFAAPLRLRHQRVRVQVTVPDEEVESAAPFNAHPAVLERAQAMLAHMAAIKNAPLSPCEAIPESSEKQQECIEAFAFREGLKNATRPYPSRRNTR